LQLQQAAAIKHKTSPARLAQLLHNCCSPHYHLVLACSQWRYAVIGSKLKQNSNEGCNSCANLAGSGLVLSFVVSFIACFIALVITPLSYQRRCKLACLVNFTAAVAWRVCDVSVRWQWRRTLWDVITVVTNYVIVVVINDVNERRLRASINHYCCCQQD